MGTPIKILMVEDSADDAALLLDALQTAGFDPTWKRVETERDYLANLGEHLDLIFSDFSLPHFSTERALDLLQKSQLNIPFIIVSGTIGEELAVESMKAGAMDYLLKDRLARLGSAVERALRETREHVRRRAGEQQLLLQTAALEAAANSVIITDHNGSILWVNRAFTGLTGYTLKDVAGKTPRVLKSGKDERAFYSELWETILAGKTWRGELTNRRKDGTLFDGEQTITPVRSPGGAVTHFIGIMDDVSERKRSEEAMRLMHVQLQQLLNHSPAVLYAWKVDPEKPVPYLTTENVAGLLGFTVAETLDSKWWEAQLHPEDRARAIASIAETTGKGASRTEYRLRHKDGTDRWIEDHRQLVRDAAGGPIEFVGVWTDITEKKQLEAQFLRAQRLDCIGQLASGVAHDLNNILTPILMSVTLLRQKLTPDDLEETVERIEQSTRRGAQVVKQLLSLGRGSEGQRALVQPGHLIREMAKIVWETFPKSIKVEQKISRELWLLTADATQLHQVLLNLCVNARDAMPEGGTLSMRAENLQIYPGSMKNRAAAPGPYVLIEVADTGAGISPQVMERLFEPFFTTKKPGKGTGLGLATVQGIVRNHNGFVEVESKLEHGTTFKVYLPATLGAVEPKPESRRTKKFVGRGETILVVDDERLLLETVRDVLAHSGYKVLTAADGIEAIAVFSHNQTRISAVVSDLMMPGLDGVALTRILKKIDPQTRILICSGLMEESNQENRVGELEALGVKRFLSKPYNEKELLGALHDALKESRASQDTLGL